jgi:hypothetical protein
MTARSHLNVSSGSVLKVNSIEGTRIMPSSWAVAENQAQDRLAKNCRRDSDCFELAHFKGLNDGAALHVGIRVEGAGNARRTAKRHVLIAVPRRRQCGAGG